jgi:hypothetical protein
MSFAWAASPSFLDLGIASGSMAPLTGQGRCRCANRPKRGLSQEDCCPNKKAGWVKTDPTIIEFHCRGRRRPWLGPTQHRLDQRIAPQVVLRPFLQNSASMLGAFPPCLIGRIGSPSPRQPPFAPDHAWTSSCWTNSPTCRSPSPVANFCSTSSADFTNAPRSSSGPTWHRAARPPDPPLRHRRPSPGGRGLVPSFPLALGVPVFLGGLCERYEGTWNRRGKGWPVPLLRFWSLRPPLRTTTSFRSQARSVAGSSRNAPRLASVS